MGSKSCQYEQAVDRPLAASEQRQWHRGHGGVHGEWVDGEPASTLIRNHRGVVSGAASETTGERALIDRFHRTHRQRIQTSGQPKVYCQAISDNPRQTTDHAPHCSKDQRPRARTSTGAAAEPDGGLPPLATARKKIEELWVKRNVGTGSGGFTGRGCSRSAMKRI